MIGSEDLQNKKLEKLIAKSEELEKKIKENADKKAQLDKEIQQARAVEIMKFLAENAIPFGESLFRMLVIVKKAIDCGLSADDLEKMIELKKMTVSVKSEDKDEKKTD